MHDKTKIGELIFELTIVLRMPQNFLLIKLKRSKETPLSASEASGATGTTAPRFFKEKKMVTE